jgi:hypothetical protein
MLTDPHDKYACLTDEERKTADRLRKAADIIASLMKACDSLMGEVVGKSVTDWGLVNNALVDGGRFKAQK